MSTTMATQQESQDFCVPSFDPDTMCWIPVCRPSKKQLEKAIQGGYCCVKNEPIYIGRIFRDKCWITGKVIGGQLYVCYRGEVNIEIFFELLVKYEQPKCWIPSPCPKPEKCPKSPPPCPTSPPPCPKPAPCDKDETYDMVCFKVPKCCGKKTGCKCKDKKTTPPPPPIDREIQHWCGYGYEHTETEEYRRITTYKGIR